MPDWIRICHNSIYLTLDKISEDESEDQKFDMWDKVFKNGPGKICGRQP